MKTDRYIRQYTYVLCIFCILLFSFSCKKSDKDSKEYIYYTDFKFEEPAVTGKTFYIDPVNGSLKGDGSAEHPWLTLQSVVDSNLIEYYTHTENYNAQSSLKVVNPGAPVKGGDKLLLRSGYHGFINQNVFIFKEWLTIAAQEGNTPILSRFKLEGTFEKIYLKNLSIIKDNYVGTENFWETDDINYNDNSCVYLGSSSFWGKGSYVKLYGLTIKTTVDASSWSDADWIEKSASGISLRSAEHVEIVNCTLENIAMGISIEYNSDNCSAVHNSIKYYSIDGSRIISNNVLFAYNTISGCLKIDENHDDAIQSYSRGADGSPGNGVLTNVTIRGNLIIGIADKNNPKSSSPQGIGCFDGFFDNWIVENNVVIVNHYHGISFYGMRNSKIINNTVIDQIPGDDTSPWIMITSHKNGSPSENCIVANNIASSSISATGSNVQEYNNYVLGKSNYNTIYDAFVDPDNNNFHLLNNDFTNAHIIDKGTFLDGMISSDMDKDLIKRTSLPDLGAYEVVK
jgi:parallel beta-helix repeat protein